jgi:hypothetical protein
MTPPPAEAGGFPRATESRLKTPTHPPRPDLMPATLNTRTTALCHPPASPTGRPRAPRQCDRHFGPPERLRLKARVSTLPENGQ